MTNKTTMPEPVAYVLVGKDGLNEHYTQHVKYDGMTPLITTDQAEAYANARVLEALEEAIKEVMRCKTSGIIRNGAVDKCADAIRALIPATK